MGVDYELNVLEESFSVLNYTEMIKIDTTCRKVMVLLVGDETVVTHAPGQSTHLTSWLGLTSLNHKLPYTCKQAGFKGERAAGYTN